MKCRAIPKKYKRPRNYLRPKIADARAPSSVTGGAPSADGEIWWKHIINISGYIGALIAVCICISACFLYGTLTFYGLSTEIVPITFVDLTKNTISALPYFALVVILGFVCFVYLGSILDWIFKNLRKTLKGKFDVVDRIIFQGEGGAGMLLCVLAFPIVMVIGEPFAKFRFFLIYALFLLQVCFVARKGTNKATKLSAEIFIGIILFIAAGNIAGCISMMLNHSGHVEVISLSNGNRIVVKVVGTYEKGILVNYSSHAVFLSWDEVRSINYGLVDNSTLVTEKPL